MQLNSFVTVLQQVQVNDEVSNMADFVDPSLLVPLKRSLEVKQNREGCEAEYFGNIKHYFS